MVKKLGSIGLSIAIALLASPAMADLSFWGGNMTGTTNIEPTQELTIGLTGIHNGTQGLTSGNAIGFATTSMSGLVADNQYLTRSVSGTIGKTISDRQVTSANSTQTGTSAGYRKPWRPLQWPAPMWQPSWAMEETSDLTQDKGLTQMLYLAHSSKRPPRMFPQTVPQ